MTYEGIDPHTHLRHQELVWPQIEGSAAPSDEIRRQVLAVAARTGERDLLRLHAECQVDGIDVSPHVVAGVLEGL